MFQFLEISNYILCWVIIHCHNTHSSYGYLLYSMNKGKKYVGLRKNFSLAQPFQLMSSSLYTLDYSMVYH